MNLYTKDHLLENKIVYFQPQQGYRSGIEPIILAAQANYNDKSILDLGSGCGFFYIVGLESVNTS